MVSGFITFMVFITFMGDTRAFTVTGILLIWIVQVALREFAYSMKTQKNWVPCLKITC